MSGAADIRGRACVGVLERCEGLVLFETLRKVLDGLGIKPIFLEAANGAGIGVSATHSKIGRGCGILEVL